MKKLLLFISLFISVFAVAQTPSTIYKVPALSNLSTYFGNADRLYVVSVNQDYVTCNPCLTDSVAGAGGRKWKKLVAVTAPITQTTGYIGIPQATGSVNGYLSSTDWSTFNGKGRVDSIRLVNTGILHTSPAAFALSGSTGVVTQTLATQTANTVFAGATSGGAATPTFRALVAGDIPSGVTNYIFNQTGQQASSNFNISGAGVIGTTLTVPSLNPSGSSLVFNTYDTLQVDANKELLLSVNASGHNVLALQNTNSSAGSVSAVAFRRSDTKEYAAIGIGNNTTTYPFSNVFYMESSNNLNGNNSTAPPISFIQTYVNGSGANIYNERMKFTDRGNIVINRNGSWASGMNPLATFSDNSGGNSVLTLSDTSLTAGTTRSVDLNFKMGSTNIGGFSSYSSNWNYHAYPPNGMGMVASNAGGLSLFATNAAGAIRFYTADDQAANLRMTIASTGRIGVGSAITSPSALINIGAGTATANTAPLKFTSGTLLTTPEAGAVEFLTDGYYVTTTTGAKRRFVVSATSGRATAQTAANASVATYTLGASDASYEVSANVLVTTSSAEAFTVTCAYTDEGNTARTQTMPFVLLAGTTAAAINFANGAVPYEGIPIHLRVKASTAITIATTGTFTGATYNVEGIIKQTQ